MDEPLVRTEDLKMYFPFKDGFRTKYIKALDGVSFDIKKGETLGIVGESGCGKSTLGRVILRLLNATSGKVYFENKDTSTLSSKEMHHLRRNMQIIFQDPFASLNPKLRVGEIIAEPLKFHGIKDKKTKCEMVENVLKTVGLNQDALKRYPHEFSGGQQQRIGIARALVLRPEFIVCDEAVSALDVSVQAQVLNLLQDLKNEFSLTYMFISHNLSVVKHICDRIAVMYLGKIVEVASRDEIFNRPLHPYTKALISAIPIPDPTKRCKRIILEGDIPSPADPPSGCRFHTRCVECTGNCSKADPKLVEVYDGHFVVCTQFSK